MLQGTLTKKGNIWYVVVDLPREGNGKRKQKWISTKTKLKREAERRLVEIVNQVQTGFYADAGGMTVGRFLEDYHQNVSRLRIRESSHRRESQLLFNQVIPYIGQVKLSQLRPSHIQSLYSRLLASGAKNGKPLSDRSVEYVHAVLHSALGHAVKTGLLPVNPTDAVERPRVARSEMKTLSWNQIAHLLRTTKDTRNYMPILIAVTTGLRAGEILALKWSDIDLQAGTLTVQRTLTQIGNEIRFTEPKTQSSR